MIQCLYCVRHNWQFFLKRLFKWSTFDLPRMFKLSGNSVTKLRRLERQAHISKLFHILETQWHVDLSRSATRVLSNTLSLINKKSLFWANWALNCLVWRCHGDRGVLLSMTPSYHKNIELGKYFSQVAANGYLHYNLIAWWII